MTPDKTSERRLKPGQTLTDVYPPEMLRFAATSKDTDHAALQRRAENAEAQIHYMTTEIAKALDQEPGAPADTVRMVRDLAVYITALEKDLRRESNETSRLA